MPLHEFILEDSYKFVVDECGFPLYSEIDKSMDGVIKLFVSEDCRGLPLIIIFYDEYWTFDQAKKYLAQRKLDYIEGRFMDDAIDPQSSDSEVSSEC